MIILTRYLEPTFHRPARVSAVTDGGSLKVLYDPEQSEADNHHRAARLLKIMLNQSGDLIQSTMPKGEDYQFAFILHN